MRLLSPAAAAAAATLAVAACSGSSSDTARPTSPPRTTRAAEPTDLPDPPTEAEQAAFAAKVRTLHPGIVEDTVSLVRHGRTICLDIAQGKPDETVVRDAAGVFAVDEVLAGHLVDAAKATICR